VSRKLDRYESQTTLGVPLAKVTRSTKRTQVQLLVVRNEEVVLRVAAETLCAVPGHVLDGHKSSVGKQDEVEHAVSNDGALVLLNHARKNAEAGWRRGVVVEYAVAALFPLLHWSVDGFLHFSAVEVDGGAFREVSKGAREAENVPQQRTCSRDLVDVPARVDQKCSIVNLVLFPSVSTGYNFVR